MKNKNLENYYGILRESKYFFFGVSEPESQELIRPQLQTKPMTKKWLIRDAKRAQWNIWGESFVE